MDEDIEIVRELIAERDRPLFLTGAGISVASGVGTYGDASSPTSFLRQVTSAIFASDPRRVWEEHLQLRRVIADKKPNAAHLALSKFCQRKPHVVLTQNIDGLHQKAGHPNVIPLHGSLWRNRCMKCGAERDDNQLEFRDLPSSPCCHVLERPAVTWFEDPLDPGILKRAILELAKCDILVIVGTSGEVQPVCKFPLIVRIRKQPIIEVNPEASGRLLAHETIREKAEIALPFLLNEA